MRVRESYKIFETENTYFPSKDSWAKIPNRLMNSKNARRVGYPAQLILIASKTPYKSIEIIVERENQNPVTDWTK